jgi:O-acetyl-ADP-ribose deacetylase (regulator of RNase III)
LKVDSIVSPANSFGYMRGGIDGFYTKKFGPGVEKDVQDLIKSEHDGEMLVGNAEIVETGDKNIPFCISAPTMRIGFVLFFLLNFTRTTLEETTTNPFLAARAVFLLWKKGQFKYGEHKGKAVRDVVNEIAFPGLGTGVGGVTYEACSFQVMKALREVLMDEFVFPPNHQPKGKILFLRA